VVNVFGYDDDELNSIIQARLEDKKVKQMVGTKLDVSKLLASKAPDKTPPLPPHPS
jgi:hypothetical protein